MRYVVFGAGAIGAVVGGRLYDAGKEVTLVARGENLRAIRDHGLLIESPSSSIHIPVPTVASVADICWSEDVVVLLAVKSHQTADALKELVRAAPSTTAIVCLQNGLANERAALRHFPDVYGISVACPACHLEPGVVQAWSSPITGILDIGRFPLGADALGEGIAADLRDATFASTAVPDILRWKRRKLLRNLTNAVEVICGPEHRDSELGIALMSEGEALFRELELPVATLREDEERRAGRLTFAPIGDRQRIGGSSWQSVERGTGDIESDFLNGEVVLLARLNGVSAPLNARVQILAGQIARGEIARESLSPSQVLAEAASAGR